MDARTSPPCSAMPLSFAPELTYASGNDGADKGATQRMSRKSGHRFSDKDLRKVEILGRGHDGGGERSSGFAISRRAWRRLVSDQADPVDHHHRDDRRLR